MTQFNHFEFLCHQAAKKMDVMKKRKIKREEKKWMLWIRGNARIFSSTPE